MNQNGIQKRKAIPIFGQNATVSEDRFECELSGFTGGQVECRDPLTGEAETEQRIVRRPE